ncbi:Phosphatidylinositolglycan class N-domain-containing protein [Zopfochytrium polystomum]|nr:Phosphatidylinositolglycan class N-domain-containing protein [Zopfochytrium polystomum]
MASSEEASSVAAPTAAAAPSEHTLASSSSASTASTASTANATGAQVDRGSGLKVNTGSLAHLLLLGIVFHAVYSFSIFDIYFRTPLVHGMTPVDPPSPPPANRLVLFVADGLRADKLFEDRVSRAPFLQDIVLNRGSWGVSHTRVPTESRPGHVALIAGFYEDVSAVTKGWKMNPVNFDSVFNESRWTWSFGSPDILPMFAEGASDPSKVATIMYSPEFEDFAEKDAAKLDTWVFDKFDEFMKEAKSNATLASQLRSDKVVLFFHLLGLDTNGHGHRPNSKEYLGNIAVVDAGISHITKKLEEFFGNDEKTAYIVTADHGMSHRGNHGDGHPDNTMTPLVAWGAGIKRSKLVRKSKTRIRKRQDSAAASDTAGDEKEAEAVTLTESSAAPLPTTTSAIDPSDPFAQVPWNLDDVVRNDVNQADIAPLMSTLIGVPFPMNSVGELPITYLDVSHDHRAEAALGNAVQILRQFLVKEDTKRRHELFFKRFAPLVRHEELLDEIRLLISKARDTTFELTPKRITETYGRAIVKSTALAELAIEGLRYYQTYDWLFLRSIVTVGYVGWIAYCILFVLKNYITPEVVLTTWPSQGTVPEPKKGKNSVRFSVKEKGTSFLDSQIDRAALGVFVVFSALLLIKRSSPIYYIYVAFPVYLWSNAFKERKYFFDLLPSSVYDEGWWLNFAKCFIYVAALELLVYSYFQREILSPCLIAGGVLWPETTPDTFKKKNWAILLVWKFFCVVLSVFTLLPVEYNEDMRLVNAGAVLIIGSGIYAAFALPTYMASTSPTKAKPGVPLTIVLQLLIIVASVLVVNDTSRRLANKEGLPSMNQTVSWAMLASSVLVPVLDGLGGSQHYLLRLVVIYLAFAPVFILLSLSYETLFYFCFCMTAMAWLVVERHIYHEVDILKANQDTIALWKKTDGIIRQPTRFRPLKPNDLWTATVFLCLINVGFFGTGNIASVSSFSLESVYRFTTTFQPFVMAALLIFKLWVPLFFLSAVFGVITRSLELPSFSLLLVVLSTTDVMTLNFFFLVRDSGSWLEIGTTISHFIIASAFIVFQILLFTVGHFLVGRISLPQPEKKRL